MSQITELKKWLFMIPVVLSYDFFHPVRICMGQVLNTGLNAFELLPSLRLQFFNSNQITFLFPCSSRK